MSVGEQRRVVGLDSRNRLSLGKVARHDKYLVSVDRSGRIVLTPAMIVSSVELEYLENTGARVAVARALSGSEAARVRRR